VISLQLFTLSNYIAVSPPVQSTVYTMTLYPFVNQFRMSISFLSRFEPPPMCVYVDKLSFQAIESLWI
jgi:hypothetical protein